MWCVLWASWLHTHAYFSRRALPMVHSPTQSAVCTASFMSTPAAAEYVGSTGTERLDKVAPPGTGLLRVVETPVIRQLFTRIRDAKTGTRDYVFYMNRLMRCVRVTRPGALCVVARAWWR